MLAAGAVQFGVPGPTEVEALLLASICPAVSGGFFS